MKHCKSIIKKAFFIFLLLFSFYDIKATHVISSELTWECLGNDLYKFNFVFYRDCTGLPYNIWNIITFYKMDTSTLLLKDTVKFDSVLDITSTCKYLDNRCGNPSSIVPFGCQKAFYSKIIDLSQINECELIISYQMASRTNQLTTGGSNTNFYNYSYLNKCNNICNNSPKFQQNPIHFIRPFDYYEFNECAFDFDIDSNGFLLDSLSFELANPLISANTPISYVGQYTCETPIYFWGFPNKNLSPPKGFYFNKQNGSFGFSPRKIENTNFVLRVNEYRNGVLISSVLRETYIVVVNSNLRTPYVLGSDSIVIYPDSIYSFEYSVSDLSYLDTHSMKLFSNYNNISSTLNTLNPTNAKLNVILSPKQEDTILHPFYFYIMVSDSSCPYQLSTVKTIMVNIQPKPPTKIILPNDTNVCENSNIQITSQFKYNRGKVDCFWSTGDSNTKTITLKDLKNDTMVVVKGIDTANYICYDSMYIYVSQNPTIGLNVYKDLCRGKSLSVFASILLDSSASLNKINWFLNSQLIQSGLIDSISVNDTGLYFCETEDSYGCSNIDSQIVKYSEPITYSFNVKNSSCYGKKDGLISISNMIGAFPFNFLWSIIDTSSSIDSLSSGLYYLKIGDSNNCITLDTFEISEPNKLEYIDTIYNSLCYNDNSGKIDIFPHGGTPPYYINWKFINDNSFSLDSLIDGSYYFTLSDSNNCELSDSFWLKSPDSIIIVCKVNDISCYGINDGSISIDVFGGTQPYNYTWSNDSTEKSISNLYSGNYTLMVSDSNNCQLHNTFYIDQPDTIEIAKISDKVYCYGDNLNLYIISKHKFPVFFQWYKDGKIIQDANDSFINILDLTFSDSGSYNCLVTDACESKFSNSSKISIYQPMKNIVPNANASFCNGDSIRIDVIPSNRKRYVWEKANKPYYESNNSFIYISSSGLYTVYSIENFLISCKSEKDTIDLTVLNSSFDVSMEGSPRILYSKPFIVAFTNTTPYKNQYNFNWNFGDSTFSGSIEPIHEYNYKGIYSIHLVAEDKFTGCIDSTIYIDYISCNSNSTIESFLKKNEISLYPNPATDLVYIIKNKNITTPNQIEIFSTNGTKLLERTLVSDEPIDVSSLSNGLYIIRVNSQNDVKYFKLIKI